MSFALDTSNCQQRPACLDSEPRCMIAEPVGGWCSTSGISSVSIPWAYLIIGAIALVLLLK